MGITYSYFGSKFGILLGARHGERYFVTAQNHIFTQKPRKISKKKVIAQKIIFQVACSDFSARHNFSYLHRGCNNNFCEIDYFLKQNKRF